MATAQVTHHAVLRLCFVLVLACAPGFAARAAAQSVPPANSSFAALQSRVTAGDTVSVRLTSGEEVAGTLVRASVVSLTLMAAGQPREIQANEVQQVVRDRGANRLRRGLLLGIPIGALAGNAGCYRVDTSYGSGTNRPVPCGAYVAAGMAVGGSLGALIGSRVTRPTVVYAALAAAPVPSTLEGISAPVPVAPRPADAARPPSARTGPVASLSSLSTRVIPFQTLYVRTRTGEEVRGTFATASDDLLRMEVGGRTWEIAAADVDEVRLRGGRQVKQGALTGLAGGAVILGASFGAGAADDKDDSVAAAEGDSVGAAVLFGAVVGGAGGLLWGSLIGALVHERPLVYTSATPSVRVTPLVAPRQVGVLASVRF